MAAITFPLSVAAFQSLLKVAAVEFSDPAQQEASGLGSGEVLRADVGPQLWRGRVTLAPAYHETAQATEALLSLLQRADASFFVHDPRRVGPIADPDGAILDDATPTIHTLAANNRELRVQGLPVGYVLSVGDMIAFEYTVLGTTRYALHRLVAGATAPGTGITPLFEVTPAIRPGAAVSAAVTLVRPACKAVMMPGTVRYGSGRPLITSGASFDFIQTLR
jgi:hypothetical protein